MPHPRHLAERADEDRQPARGVGHRGAARVPGDGGCCEPKLPGERVQHRGAMLAHRRQRADRPAERCAEDVRAHLALARSGMRDARQPDRGLEAERDRRCVLAIGPPRARRGAVGLGHRDQAGENGRRDPHAAVRRRRASAARARYRGCPASSRPCGTPLPAPPAGASGRPSRTGSSGRRQARSPLPVRPDRVYRARSPRWLRPGSAAQVQPAPARGPGRLPCAASRPAEPGPRTRRASALSRRADRSGRNRATKRPCPLPRRPASGATVHLERKPT